MQEHRFAQFILAVDRLQKCVQELEMYYAPEFGVKGVHILWVDMLLSYPEGLTASELAAKCSINRSLVSREIGYLREQGYVSAVNGRGYNQPITLTEKGKRAAQGISERIKEIQGAVDTGVTREELATFYRVMFALCQNFEALTQDKGSLTVPPAN